MADSIFLVLPELVILEGVRAGMKRTAFAKSLFHEIDIFQFLPEDFLRRTLALPSHFLYEDVVTEDLTFHLLHADVSDAMPQGFRH